MKLQRFSQFITESTNPLTVETVESEISATAHTLLPKKSWTRAKTYLDLDFNALIKRAAVTATGIFTNFGNTINSPNFDPKTIEAEVLKLEQALYSLTNREVDLIMQGVGPLATVALFTFKKTWKEEFLANNAAPYDSPIGKIVGSIINLILNTQSQGAFDNSGGLKDSVYATQKQIIKAGKPVPPFTIRRLNNDTVKYGAFKYIDGSSFLYQEYHESPRYPGKSIFADGSTIDGCYNLDYWEAIWELLNDRWPRIVKTIVTNIAAKVFA